MDNTITMQLKTGPVKIELRTDLAPLHVARIRELTKEGFYDGVVFHRVIPGFMAQTGDPTGTGSGGSKKPNLKAEFSREVHGRGTCSMARSARRLLASKALMVAARKSVGMSMGCPFSISTPSARRRRRCKPGR